MAESAFEVFAGRERARVVRFLERNQSVAAFVQGLAEQLAQWAAEHGVEPEQVEISLPFIGHDEYIRARVTKKL